MLERGNLSRRGFMNRSVAAMSAAGLPLWFAKDAHGADEAVRVARAKAAGANDKINFGYVGIGSPQSRAYAIYGGAKRNKGVYNAAVCDVDAPHLKRAAADFKKDGFEAKEYDDFRRLTDDKSLDVVVVATPDHWHCLAAIEALRKGKDVYCEKPLTLTIEEALALQKVVKETGKVLQTGSQQRTEMKQFRLAVELVRAGRIGKVKTIECRIGGVNPSGPIPEAPVPEGLNWDMWLGPTAKAPYRVKDGKDGRYGKTNCHYEFRWYYEYSGGKMTDWGAHHLDIAQWALGMDGSGPTSVEAIDAAEQEHKAEGGYNCHKTFRVKYTYADGTEVFAMDGRGTDVKGLVKANGKPLTTSKRNRDKDGKPIDGYTETPIEMLSGGANGVLFVGETGTIFVDRQQLLASDAKIISEPLGKDDPMLYPSRPTDHVANFIDCIKTREKPICDATVGGGSVIVCHLGVIALQMGVGTKLTWDPKANTFTGDNADKANKMKGREMRAPWKLEV